MDRGGLNHLPENSNNHTVPNNLATKPGTQILKALALLVWDDAYKGDMAGRVDLEDDGFGLCISPHQGRNCGTDLPEELPAEQYQSLLEICQIADVKPQGLRIMPAAVVSDLYVEMRVCRRLV